MESEYETIYPQVRKATSDEDGTLEVTIDRRVAIGIGLKVGDTVKILIKRWGQIEKKEVK